VTSAQMRLCAGVQTRLPMPIAHVVFLFLLLVPASLVACQHRGQSSFPLCADGSLACIYPLSPPAGLVPTHPPIHSTAPLPILTPNKFSCTFVPCLQTRIIASILPLAAQLHTQP
jgi:hypothetical protein